MNKEDSECNEDSKCKDFRQDVQYVYIEKLIQLKILLNEKKLVDDI